MNKKTSMIFIVFAACVIVIAYGFTRNLILSTEKDMAFNQPGTSEQETLSPVSESTPLQWVEPEGLDSNIDVAHVEVSDLFVDHGELLESDERNFPPLGD